MHMYMYIVNIIYIYILYLMNNLQLQHVPGQKTTEGYENATVHIYKFFEHPGFKMNFGT